MPDIPLSLNSNGSDTESGALISERDATPRHPMEAVLKQRSDATMYLKQGDVVEGIVLSREGNKLFIDLGTQGVGVVFGREFYEAQHIVKGLEIGSRVAAKVAEVESSIVEGYPELSLKEAGKEKLWTDLRDMLRQGTAIILRVKEVNRGGLLLEYNGVPGFLPVSQLSQKNYPRVEGGDKEKIYEELKKFLGKEMKVKVIDVDQNENKLIFSERELDDDALRSLVAKHTVSEEVDGEITAIAPFGAFVRLTDGLEGLIHVSEVDWSLVQDPRDIVSVGEKVRAKIISIEGTKISLSLKALKEDPWLKFQEVVKKGDSVKGTVTKFNPFGAFVRIQFKTAEGDLREVQGLTHISEFGTDAKMREALSIGKEYEFTVTAIDLREHRMSLVLPKKEESQKQESPIPPLESAEADQTGQASVPGGAIPK